MQACGLNVDSSFISISCSMAHIQDPREYWASAPYVGHDYVEDPLLPQKALPLPDDLDVDAALQNGPGDVLAAAASAMEACDALPDEVAETVMQPLAEAYLLAVRREARLLPNVVSAVSAKNRRRKNYSSKDKTSASQSDASSMPKEPCACVNEGSVSEGTMHKSNGACQAEMAATETSSSSAHTDCFTTPAVPKAHHPCRQTSQIEAAMPSSEIAAFEDSSEQASSSNIISEASSDEDSLTSEGENLAESKESLAQFMRRELHSAEGTHKDAEARPGGVGKCKEQGSCIFRLAGESGVKHRCREDASQSQRVDENGDSDAHIPAKERSAEVANIDGERSARPSTCGVKESGAFGPEASLDGDRAGGDFCCDAALGVATGGVSLPCKTTATEGVPPTGTPVSAGGSATVASSTRRPQTKKSDKISKNTRQKLATYVDRLVLLDKQREAACASASAPAAAWRATALLQFKELRRYVTSHEFVVQDYPEPGTAADCSTWSEQEWRLYCRCYPPSLGVLGRCDTMTLCRLLFLLVEDVEQQQRVIAKTQRERGSHGDLGSCALDRVRKSQPLLEDVTESTEKEHSNSVPRLADSHILLRSTDREPAQGGEGVSVAHAQQARAQEGVEINGELNSMPRDERHSLGSDNHLQQGKESNSPLVTSTEDDKGGASAATAHALVKHTQGLNSFVHSSDENDADKIAGIGSISYAGSCRCCTHCDCCLTLQQASWLFGIFLFLDELQAMEADAAACIQQLRRLCESARERAAGCAAASQQQPPTRQPAGDIMEDATGAQGEAVLPVFYEKRATMLVPTDLVAALNLLIVVINDFFNQR